MGKTWLITGATRGFGRCFVEAALEAGDNVAAGARNIADVQSVPGTKGRLLPVKLDVTDRAQIAEAVAQTEAEFGGIDVLLNNAGFGVMGAIEEVAENEAREIFEVNFFGTLWTTQAVLPGMRARRSGLILNNSSIGGFRGGAGWGLYSATKFAMEGLSEALRPEVEPLGIKVCILEPGHFRTDFLDPRSLTPASGRIDDYRHFTDALQTRILGRNHQQEGNPDEAARAVVELSRVAEPPLRLPLGSDAMDVIEEKIAQVEAEMKLWRPLASKAGKFEDA